MKDDRGDLDLTKIIEDLKTELQFSGEYDNFDALITISGGAGGVEWRVVLRAGGACMHAWPTQYNRAPPRR